MNLSREPLSGSFAKYLILNETIKRMDNERSTERIVKEQLTDREGGRDPIVDPDRDTFFLQNSVSSQSQSGFKVMVESTHHGQLRIDNHGNHFIT